MASMPQGASDTETLRDGVCDFSGGVDSLKVPQLQSAVNPNGLSRNQLAWLINGTVRDGAISPRDGLTTRGIFVGPKQLAAIYGTTYQGATMYLPKTGTPYILAVVGGHVIQIDPNFFAPPIDLSSAFGFYLPQTTKSYFCQAGQFMVIQGGDYNPVTSIGTLPLFWDGQTLSQSNGLTGVTSRGSGATLPVQFYVEVVQPWTALGGTGTTTLQLSTTYPGNLYDNVSVVDSGGTARGTYRVTSLSSNTMTLTWVASGGNATAPSGQTIFTLVLPQSGNLNQTLTVESATYSFGTIQQTSIFYGGSQQQNQSGLYIFQQAGPPVTFQYLFPSMPYQGPTPTRSRPVSILLTDTANDGTFSADVVGTVSGGVEITNITFRGGVQFGVNYYDVFSYEITPGWIQPSQGNSVTIPVNALYNGSVGDSITIPNVGNYTVTAFSPTSITLLAVNANNPGQPGPTTINLTIESVQQTTGTNLNQIPPATCMAFYMGRIWYAQGNTVTAGDIQGGPSGTSAYDFEDSVLYVTENPLAVGGDGFTMPSGSDNITALSIPQMINASLGQGLLNIGTANAWFTLQVPVTRQDWIAANTSNLPQINVIQMSNGPVNDWCVTSVNGDLWFDSNMPDVRSLLTAVRYFQQWGNVSLSSNEDYILSEVDTALMGNFSSVYFDNRRLGTTLPTQSNYGIVHNAIIPLDLTTISTLEQQDPPNWEGHYEGVQILQLLIATFNGQQRAFAIVLSSQTQGQMEVLEFVAGQVGDNGNRIQWQATTAAFTWGQEFRLKKLVAAELWVDQLIGNADVTVEYCPDGSSCFYEWAAFSVCSANSSQQGQDAPAYPPIQFQPGIRKPIVLPKPPEAREGQNSRPAYILYDCQLRITVKGQLRLRGFMLHAEKVDRPLYENVIRIATKWIKAMFRL